jgi:hypothetical protein
MPLLIITVGQFSYKRAPEEDPGQGWNMLCK